MIIKKISNLFQPIILSAVKLAITDCFKKIQQNQVNDPINSFILGKNQSDEGHFNLLTYGELRTRRISKILEIFGTDFKGQKILELGGGTGEMGAFFASLGADVVSAEYQQQNRDFANIKYGSIKNFKSIFFDAEKKFTSLGRFDLIICTSFLEVIQDLDNVIKNMVQMTDNVILETQVSDSIDPLFIRYVERGNTTDTCVVGKLGSQPSPAYIERVFIEHGWTFDRHFTKDLDTKVFDFSWEHKNDGAEDSYPGPRALRRFWHFKKGDNKTNPQEVRKNNSAYHPESKSG